jgi:tetratricopeptide (TPR) repeat protein
MSDPPAAASVMGHVAPAQTPQSYTRGKLILPRWFPGAITLIVIGVVVEAFLVTVIIGNEDWVVGAKIAAFTAFGIAAIGLVVAIVRATRRHWKQASFTFNVAMVAVLALVGTGGLLSRLPIRSLQARQYEAAGDWNDALRQYARMASDSSCGHDCRVTVMSDEARARYNYGLQREARHDYQGAVSEFEKVLALTPVQPYARQSSAEMAHAQYEYGLQLSAQHSYQAAITEFTATQAAAPNGPYAHLAHLAAATAYYAFAQTEIPGTSCEYALGNLEIVMRDYADAPEAQLAKVEFARPVTVDGFILGFPTGAKAQVWLSKSAWVPPRNAGSAPPGTYGFSGDYKTSLDITAGYYQFTNVVPGTYTVSTYREIASAWNTTWWYDYSEIGAYYLQVGPLCPFTWTTLQCENLCR